MAGNPMSNCRDALLRRLVPALFFLVASLLTAPSWAQGSCPPPTPKGKVSEDFNPGGPRPPEMPGNVYSMPGVLRDEFLVAWWLQGFYNGLPNFERGSSAESDSLMLSKYFVDVLRQQAQVQAVVGPAKDTLKQNAYEMMRRLACGQSGTFSNRGREVVMGDDDSYSVHLAIGSFSVFWEATCEIGPKKCCVKNSGSESGYEETAAYSCRINFTIYDNFNFSWKSGTGGTGLLKRINPLGWLGTSFHQYGRWSETDQRNAAPRHVGCRCGGILLHQAADAAPTPAASAATARAAAAGDASAGRRAAATLSGMRPDRARHRADASGNRQGRGGDRQVPAPARGQSEEAERARRQDPRAAERVGERPMDGLRHRYRDRHHQGIRCHARRRQCACHRARRERPGDGFLFLRAKPQHHRDPPQDRDIREAAAGFARRRGLHRQHDPRGTRAQGAPGRRSDTTPGRTRGLPEALSRRHADRGQECAHRR
jgi:hypothetical protein